MRTVKNEYDVGRSGLAGLRIKVVFCRTYAFIRLRQIRQLRFSQKYEYVLPKYDWTKLKYTHIWL